MSAGLSTLNYLKSNKQTIYTKLNSLGEQLRKRLTRLFNDSKINVKVTGMGSLFMPHFLGRRDNNKDKVDNALDVATANQRSFICIISHLWPDTTFFFFQVRWASFSDAHNAMT